MKNFLLVLCFCFISAISFSQDIWEGKNVRSGLIDLKGNEIIKPEKEYIYNPISDSFCFTDKSWDNFGYGSLDGNIIIPVETWHEIYPVNNLLPVQKSGKVGIYDLKGNLIFPFKYDMDQMCFSFATLNAGTLISCLNEKYGLVDLKDKEIIPLKYDSLLVDLTLDNKLFLKSQLNDKFGYLEMDGKEILPCIYDFIGEFNYDCATVKKDKYWGVVNTKGKFVFGPTDKYEKIYAMGPDGVLVSQKGKWGLIKKGELIMPIEYDTELDEDCELGDQPQFLTLSDGKNKYAFDKQGNLLFMCSADYCFKNDRSTKICDDRIIFYIKKKRLDVRDNNNQEEYETQEIYGVMNSKGNVIVEPAYEMIENYVDGYAIADKNNYLSGIIDKNGKVVIPFEYAFIWDFKNGIAIVGNLDLKYGVIDINNKKILPLKYQNIERVGDVFAVKENYKYSLYNLEGKQISKVYDKIEIMDKRIDSKGFLYIYGCDKKPQKYLSVINGCKDLDEEIDKYEMDDCIPLSVKASDNKIALFSKIKFFLKSLFYKIQIIIRRGV